MAYLGLRFPTTISYGSSGGPEYSTDIVEVSSGNEQRNSNWQYPKFSTDVAHAARTKKQNNELINFFHLARGRANTFRFKDAADFEADITQGILGLTGLGDGGTVYQMYKKYSSGSNSQLRKITRPVASTVKVYKNGSELTITSDYTIAAETGVITLASSASGSDTLTWTGEFDIHCRFDIDKMVGEHIAPNIFGWNSIPIIEVRE